MSTRGIIWTVTVTVFIIGASASWWWTCTDRIIRTERTHFSTEALRDRLLAAKRMLQKLGIEVMATTHPEWDRVVQKDGTLMIFNNAWTLGDARFNTIMHWVNDGGHLILAPGFIYERDDEQTSQSLIARLGVTLSPIDESDDDKATALYKARYNTISQVNHGGERLRVKFLTSVRFKKEGFRVLSQDQHGACALRRGAGAGHITVLCSDDPFTNRNIGEQQNASLLWQLAAMQGQRPLWMVMHTDMPPLYLWAWRRFPEAIVFATLGVICLWWAAARRAGPVRDLPLPERRQTIEHVEAASRFIWRHSGGRELLAGLRRVFQVELERRHPTWAKLSPDQRIARLARHSRLTPEAVHLALEADDSGKQRNFTAAVRTLQILRRSL